MTEAELDRLAEKIAAKVEHKACPLGMDADAVEAARMLGRAQHNVQADDGAYVVLLRIGKESNSIVIRAVRILLISIAVAALLVMVSIGGDHLARWVR